MSLALHYWMGDVHHCSRAPISEMTYTVSSGTLNATIPYHTYHPNSSQRVKRRGGKQRQLGVINLSMVFMQHLSKNQRKRMPQV